MKTKILLPFLLFLSALTIQAQQDSTQQHFTHALAEISSMLEGIQPLDFERAVFVTENAYRVNAVSYQDFKASLDIHSSIIEKLIKANAKEDWKKYQPVSMGIPMETDEETKENYRKALANWAIYTYLTDTTKINVQVQQFLHLPYAYSNDDPFGSIEWKNSQVLNLLETQKGNCYALVTLFKIFSERFHSEANIVTAPQHVYIEHRDPKGDLYNVEVATRSFPGTGSIQTLTYTTREALLNNISLRSLNLKQSIGLCLVYLAKGYEHKYKTKADGFLLTCAEKVLEHDAKNLNALLLKAQVYEQRVMKKEMPAATYEKMLAELYALGYRQMPDDMKAIILAKIQGNSVTATINKTPNPFESIGEQARYATLSGGIFEEVHTPQKLVRVGQTIFNTEKSKIEKFLEGDNSSYQVDPVVFALSVDPLTNSYPMLTPYQFASNSPIANIDMDGQESLYYQINHDKESGETKIELADTKTSYLDKLLPYHVNVSIDGGEYQYAGDYALSFEGQRKALTSDLEEYAKNPQQAIAKMTMAKETAEQDAAENRQFWGQDLWVNAFTVAWASKTQKGTFSNLPKIWKTTSDGNYVGKLATKLGDKVLAVDKNFAYNGKTGDVDIVTAKLNIEVKSGGKPNLTQSLKNQEYAKSQGKAYVLYMPKATNTQIFDAAKKGIKVIKDEAALKKEID